jgi:PPK2 family polyphosphate:nucleotide phosphotransferase
MKIDKLGKTYRVESGKHFRLKDFDPADTGNCPSKEYAEEALQQGIQRTVELQDKLYAQDNWAVLLIFQAMDAAGKDGAISHVMSGVNPQGCQVYSFKVPTETELQHDFLWRTTSSLPERGHIGIFNRSYYEEVLVVRVHPEILKSQKTPPSLIGKKILNLSKKEQKQRFLARLEHPEKNWKFSAADIRERKYWDDYQDAYEDMIRNTASEEAPWYVVPADNKWFTRLVVSMVLVDTLESLKLSYPKVDPAKRKELEAAKRELLARK